MSVIVGGVELAEWSDSPEEIRRIVASSPAATFIREWESRPRDEKPSPQQATVPADRPQLKIVSMEEPAEVSAELTTEPTARVATPEEQFLADFLDGKVEDLAGRGMSPEKIEFVLGPSFQRLADMRIDNILDSIQSASTGISV